MTDQTNAGLEAVAWMFRSPLNTVSKLQWRKPCMTAPEEHGWRPLTYRSDADTIIAGKNAEIVRLTKENKALAEPPSRSDCVRALLYGRKIDELQATIAQHADLLEKQQRDALVMVQHNQQQAERIAELDAANERHRELARISRDAELSAVRIAAAQSAALAKANTLCGKLASAWFYGDWIAETGNEREMQEIMEQLGWWPVESEDKLISAIDALKP